MDLSTGSSWRQEPEKPGSDSLRPHTGNRDVIGRNISSYRVLEPLDAAGLGETWLAHDTGVGRLVALRMLPAGIEGGGEAVEDAVRAAMAACKPSHPHICTVHSSGEHEGRPFVVMEVAEGVPLSRRLGHGPLDTDLLLDIGVQIADALRTAHSRGVFHGALDTGNVLITEGDQIKVMDFGLARLSRGGADADGPEEDIRALGRILYAMAAGREEASSDAGPGRPPASSVNPAAPASLDSIIERALGAGSSASASDLTVLVEDLTRVMAEAAPEYVPPPPPDPAMAVERAKGGGLPWKLLVPVILVAAIGFLLLRSCG